LGSTTVTCRATDARGNQTTGTFNVVVRDTTAPVLTLRDIITAEAESAAGAVVNFNTGARDAIDGVLPVVCTPASGATFPLGSTTVRCTATDKSGNVANGSKVVNVVDTRPPAIRVPDNVTASASSRAGTAVTFTVSATDAVDGNLSPVCTPRSGAVFGIGDTTVSCRANDAAGNTSTGTFRVTVANTTPPTLQVPSNQTVEATGPAGATVTFTSTANSIVDGSIAPVCSPASGSIFPLGTTTVTCRATDQSNNTVAERFSVTVTDSTAPVLNVPANQTVEANNGRRGAVVQFNATATDRVDTTVAPVCTPRSGSTFPMGTTQVNCVATDRSGNSITASFNVVVQDTTAPVIAQLPDQRAEAASSAGAVVSFSPTASDAADGALTPVCTPASGDTFPIGTTPVTCRATDQADLASTMTFNVQVADTTAPVLNPMPNIAVPATSPNGAVVSYTVTANDTVDGAVATTCAPASGSMFPVGDTQVNCTATDKAGNPASGSFVVTVNRDNVGPQLNLPNTITEQATSDQGSVVNYSATAIDNLDGALPVTCSIPSGSLFPLGPTLVECSATDSASNVARGNFTVVITPAPRIEPTPTVAASETPTVIFTNTAVSQQPGTQQVAILAEASPEIGGSNGLTQTVGTPPAPFLSQGQ
jgi:hypothetical protein